MLAPTTFRRINSQRQFEHRKFDTKCSSSKVLDKILRYCTQLVLGYMQLKFVQMDSTQHPSMDIIEFLD